MKPGSFLWLVGHDVRLNWRRFAGMFGGAGPRLVVASLMAGVVGLHLVAWPVARALSPLLFGPGDGSAVAVLIGCVFTWMIAQSLFGASRALYDRGDLDLLLASPLPPRRVFAAKATAVAASTFGSIAVLLLPVAHAGAVTDRVEWLAVYPLLAGLTLAATAVALALAIVMFFGVGPRRARIYIQTTGAVIGGAFVLGAQLLAMLPGEARGGVLAWFRSVGADAGMPGQILRAAVSLPVRALAGDPGAMAALLISALVLFLAVVELLSERFARASLAAAGAAGSVSAKTGGGTKSRAFRPGAGRALRTKEWRVLARDPNLFAQLGLQIVYTIPVAVVLLRSETLPAVLAVAPTIVVIASQVSASLAWLTVSGEDAPELIATAPVRPGSVDRAKLAAVVLPVSLILAVPLAGLALLSWRVAAITALASAGAGASSALLNLWHPMPGDRRGMLRRHAQSKVVGLVEHLLAALWAVALIFLLMTTVFAAVPLAIIGLVLVAACIRHRRERRRAGRRPDPSSAAAASPAAPSSPVIVVGR
jgi:ABC-2 type transport system permease protein